jgi:hypothetical protein
MKVSEYNQMMKWLTRPSRKKDEMSILKYIDVIKEKYGDSEPERFNDKILRQGKYEPKKNLPKYNDWGSKKIVKKPKPTEPLNLDWKLGDLSLIEEQNKIYFDSVLDKEDYKPKPDKPEETKKPRQGLAYLLEI